MTTLPLFAEDTPARLPLSEFMAGLPGKLMSLLLPVFLIACVCHETANHLTNFSSWHLLLTRSFPQPRGLLSLSLSTTSIIARAVLSVVLAHIYVPFAVPPFTRWVERLGSRPQGIRGIDALHNLALLIVQACWVVCLFLLNQFFLPATLFILFLYVLQWVTIRPYYWSGARFLYCSKTPINAVLLCNWNN